MTSAASVQAYPFTGVTVVHPPHLEGDPSLATEILPGPPSLAAIRQPPKKLDPKRPAPPFSYLPSSDPGTTYTGLAGAMAPPLEEGGPRRKRARVDKGPTNRAQRASARIITNGAPSVTEELQDNRTASSSQVVLESDAVPIPVDESEPSLSRSASSQNLGEGPSRSTNGRSKRTLKGKGKEMERDVERPAMRVKEEPVVAQIPDLPPPPAQAAPTNEDHCSSCTSLGALVYCDGCPRAFHLWCLDPPMEATDLPEGDDRWYCPKCKSAQVQPPRLPPSLLSPLIQQLHTTLPTEFQLPEDIRNFFRGVATGPRGTYLDNSNFKPPRVGRHGFGEERDPYRLRDNKGAPALCFRCNKSSLPDGVAESASSSTKRARRSTTATPGSEQWKTIIPCDYCNLHWHLDCVDPPLPSLPPLGKKWKCPNHASNAAPPKRVPKNNAPPIEITGPQQFNNGHIEIINSEAAAFNREKVDEVLINGRRYRVPERVIILDFWGKVRQNQNNRSDVFDYASAASSPLTSLSSLDGSDDPPPQLSLPSQLQDDDTLQVAQMLCSLQTLPSARVPPPPRPIRVTSEAAIQTEPDNSVRLGRKDTEHLSGIMKAALKEVAPTAPKDVSEIVKIPSSSKLARSTNPSSSPTKRSRVAANGKKTSRTARAAAALVAAPLADASLDVSNVPNGKHGPGMPSTPTRTPSRPPTPRTTSLSDVESKPQLHSLKIRIPRLSAINHAASHSPAAASSLSSAPKPSAAASSSPLPTRTGPRRSLRRQTSASGSSTTPSLIASGTSPSKARQLHERTNSGDAWDSTS